MAAKKQEKTYEVKVKGNSAFCGVGAGGVQFAYGKATMKECRMLNWYREHKGYEVTEIAEKTDIAEA